MLAKFWIGPMLEKASSKANARIELLKVDKLAGWQAGQQRACRTFYSFPTFRYGSTRLGRKRSCLTRLLLSCGLVPNSTAFVLTRASSRSGVVMTFCMSQNSNAIVAEFQLFIDSIDTNAIRKEPSFTCRTLSVASLIPLVNITFLGSNCSQGAFKSLTS